MSSLAAACSRHAQWVHALLRRLAGAASRHARTEPAAMVGLSRQRSQLAYKAFVNEAADQMREFHRSNRHWHQ